MSVSLNKARNKVPASALDALVLAGDGRAYVPVVRRNKALIQLNGRGLVEYVIEAMDRCQLIKSITVVGPVRKFSPLVSGLKLSKPIQVIPQQENIVRNMVHGYEQIRPKHDEPILVATSDIPLVTPGELEHFIECSDYDGYDYVMGLATERAMEPYYPKGRKRGMRMSYLYFRQFAARINNLHIINPSVVKHPEYAGILYTLRYQKRLGNFIKMMLEILMRVDIPSYALVKWGSLLEIAVQLDRFGLYDMARAVGQRIDVHEVEDVISRTLGIRFKAYAMDMGTAALDIDNRRDLETMRRRFLEWRELSAGLEAEVLGPSSG